MAWRSESNELQAIWEQVMSALTAHGLDDLKRPLELLLNEAMKAERSAHLNAGPWQRTPARCGHANGFKPKTLTTRLGALDLRVPQVRDSDWYPSVLERGLRSEKTAPTLAAWMEANVPEGLTVLELPIEHRTRCRTVKGLERLNKELARRTRVATLFPNEESLLRLVTAVIGEIDEDWATGKIYLTMKPNH